MSKCILCGDVLETTRRFNQGSQKKFCEYCTAKKDNARRQKTRNSKKEVK